MSDPENRVLALVQLIDIPSDLMDYWLADGVARLGSVETQMVDLRESAHG